MSSFCHHFIDQGVLDRKPAERMRAVRRDAAQPIPALNEADCAALVRTAAADSPAADVLVCLLYPARFRHGTTPRTQAAHARVDQRTLTRRTDQERMNLSQPA